jgi:hypothetical protein
MHGNAHTSATGIQVSPQALGQHDQLAAAGAGMKFDVNLPDAEAPAKRDGVAPAASTGIAPASASPAHDVGTKDAKYYLERGRVGKGALAPCPPSILDRAPEWWARLRFAHPPSLRIPDAVNQLDGMT